MAEVIKQHLIFSTSSVSFPKLIFMYFCADSNNNTRLLNNQKFLNPLYAYFPDTSQLISNYKYLFINSNSLITV